jgi:hypothetical protein
VHHNRRIQRDPGKGKGGWGKELIYWELGITLMWIQWTCPGFEGRGLCTTRGKNYAGVVKGVKRGEAENSAGDAWLTRPGMVTRVRYVTCRLPTWIMGKFERAPITNNSSY